VRWSVRATADRDAIFGYIEAQSPQAAAAVDRRIRLAVAGLRKAPGIGRPGRVTNTRELVVGRTPYIAVYEISGKVVRILRVLHGAQQWPGEIVG
jgi:toxin ParE1/3/4